jgi:hypothetical protein
MKLHGKLELHYNDNGIKFDLEVELTNENYISATELFNTLTEYVNNEGEEETIAEALENIGNTFNTFIDSIEKKIEKSKNESIISKEKESAENNKTDDQASELKNIQAQEKELIHAPEMQFGRQNEIKEPIGSFERGTISDTEYPIQNHCNQEQ